MFGTVKAMGRFALRSVFHIVYPPTCAACGRMTGADGALCPECWRDVGLIERPYCEVLGIPLSLDHGDGVVSGEAIANPPAFDRLRAVAIHDGVARKLVHRLKYQDRTDLAPFMASWMLRASEGRVGACDYIIPVPLHRRRFTQRRFNQSAELGGRCGPCFEEGRCRRCDRFDLCNGCFRPYMNHQ